VLVVDDDPASVKMLRRILTEGGYEQVRTSTDPSEVVGLCESGEFDLLLLDLTMPDLDGFEVLAALGGRLRGDPPLRVVILTGHEHPAITHRAAGLGADAVIGKTTPRDELLASLDSVIATHRGNETSSH
jgi:putative two-component system response regulator